MSPRVCLGAVAAALLATPCVAIERSGTEVVKSHCAQCHASGLLGAPVIGNAQSWQPRAAKGLDVLVRNATRGFGWGMPAHGGDPSLTQAELRRAVTEMLRASGTAPSVASNAVPAATRSAEVVVDGVVVHMSLLPSRILRQYPPGSPERAVLDDAGEERDRYLVSATLHDARTFKPIEGARLEVHLQQPGWASQLAALSPLRALARSNYARFVRLVSGAPCVATLAIRRGGSAFPIQASITLPVD